MPTDKEKKQAAVAGGAAAVAAPFTPTRVRMPGSEGSKRAAQSALKTGKASTSDLRASYRGMGGRLGNDSHTAKLAQSIKTKGYDEKQKVKIKRFKNGEAMVIGGHHRIAASEMIGKPDLPVEVQRSSAKAPYSIVPLYARGKYKRDVKSARVPGKQMSDEAISRVAGKKTPRVHQSINSAKAQVEEGITALKKPKVGVPVAAGSAAIAGGLAYKNKDKIVKRDLSNKELARTKRQQANLSTASALLGAGALGTKGASYGYSRAANGAHSGIPAAKIASHAARAKKLDRASLGILTTAAGIGSISGLKFAHVQREEAKKIEKGMPMVNAFGVSHEYVISKMGKHTPPNETTPLKEAANKGKVTLKRVGSAAKTFSSGHPYLTTAAIGAGVGGAVLAPGIIASESASRRRVKRAFGKSWKFKGAAQALEKESALQRATLGKDKKAAEWSSNRLDSLYQASSGKGKPEAGSYLARTKKRNAALIDSPRSSYKQSGIGKARGFDPEARRERRQGVYTAGLIGGSGAAGASAVKPAKQAVKDVKRAYKKGGAKKVLTLKTLEKPAVKATLTRGGLALAAATGAGAVVNQSRNSGKPYKGWYS